MVSQATTLLAFALLLAPRGFFQPLYRVGSIVLGNSFWDFWLSYVIVTIGELIILPTANTFVANLAPVDQHGRYMSFFALAQGTARSIGPLLGGILNDQIVPKAIWFGSSFFGMLGSLGFAAMSRRHTNKKPKHDFPPA